MTRHKWLSNAATTVLLVLLLAAPMAGRLSFTEAAPLQQGENLIQNPSFEGAYSPWNGINQLQVPAGWTPWWTEQSPSDPDWANHRPEWKPAEAESYPGRVHSGERALQWFKSYATYWAGAYQTVAVPQNAQLRFSAYGLAWSCEKWEFCSDATSYNPANMRMQIGIDPTGGTNPWSPAIVWSNAFSPVWGWQYVEVQAAAQGNRVTVFLLSHPDWPKQNQDTYFDDVSLVAVGAAPPPAPPPAPAPTQPSSAVEPTTPVEAPTIATATPQSDGSIVHTVRAGETLWSIAATYGLTLDEIRALNPEVGDFIYEGQKILVQEPVETAITEEPTAEPVATETEEPEPTEEAVAVAGGGELASETPEAPVEPAEPAALAAAPVEEETGGTVCVTSYLDENRSGARDANEGLLAGMVIVISNDNGELGRYTTDGASEPYCFRGLESGTYQISQEADPDWLATTLTAWGVSLERGVVENLEFGSVTAPPPTAEPAVDAALVAEVAAPEPETEQPRMQAALYTGAGIFGLLLIMGAGVFLLLSRRGR
jgi:LysM repeat protein